MANTEGIGNKFTVVKNEDLERYLSQKGKKAFNHIQGQIALGREHDGKPTYNEYVVINTDEPYADEVIEIMKRHGHWG